MIEQPWLVAGHPTCEIPWHNWVHRSWLRFVSLGVVFKNLNRHVTFWVKIWLFQNDINRKCASHVTHNVSIGRFLLKYPENPINLEDNPTCWTAKTDLGLGPTWTTWITISCEGSCNYDLDPGLDLDLKIEALLLAINIVCHFIPSFEIVKIHHRFQIRSCVSELYLLLCLMITNDFGSNIVHNHWFLVGANPLPRLAST